MSRPFFQFTLERLLFVEKGQAPVEHLELRIQVQIVVERVERLHIDTFVQSLKVQFGQVAFEGQVEVVLFANQEKPWLVALQRLVCVERIVFLSVVPVGKRLCVAKRIWYSMCFSKDGKEDLVAAGTYLVR